MSQILNYKFYLNFKNVDSFGRIEITEPSGFDGTGFVVEQDDKRWGRDVYRINEEIQLTFYKGNFDASDTMQQLPNGTAIYNLTMGFDWIMEVYNKFGFEADVDFEIELNGITFIPSNLDFSTSETDGFTKFSCNAVQTQDKQIIKRRSDIVTDIFSTEDLDGNEVAPAETQNILLRAKPITQYSKWNTPNIVEDRLSNLGADSFFYAFNFCNQTEFYAVKKTLSYLQGFRQIYNSSDYNQISDFVYIEAEDNLVNGFIDISDIDITFTNDNVFSQPLGLNGCVLRIYYLISDEFDYDEKTELHRENLDGLETYNFTGNFNIVENIERNHNFWFWFEFDIPPYTAPPNDPSGLSRPFYDVVFDNQMKVEAKYTSIAIDTVIKGVRYIDVFKENLKRVNGWELYAPRYDVGGEYYEQFAFTGNLIKQRDDVPFPVDFETINEDLMERCSDYQIIEGRNFIGQYPDFYPNNEIGAFVTSPDESMTMAFNERYVINEYVNQYETYEKDSDEENTTDAIHTDSQWLPSNKQVENSKEIKLSLIRDAFKLEKARKDGYKETTATDDDDKMFVLDVVPLSPSARGGFSASMVHNVNDSYEDEIERLQLLKDADLPSWALVGTSVGSQFNITEGINVGSYIVYEIESTIITLTPSGSIENGTEYTTVDFPYTNVSLVNRTNEGLVYFENLLNGDNFANLKYSIKRNMETWKPYLSTASIYNPNGTFKNTYFKSNGSCITQFDWESEPIQENADIENVDLGKPILTPNLYTTKLLVPFAQMVETLEALNTVNDDDTIGGFIRCIDNKERVIRLYPQSLDYVPSTEILTLTGEQKYDGEGVAIETTSETITVNEVGYDIDNLSEPFFIMEGDYLKILDVNKMLVITPTKYDEVTVNGLTFNSAIELMDYLTNI